MHRERKQVSTAFAARKRGRAGLGAGFTMIELMIVIAIIFILLGLAAGRYDMTIQRSREATLRHDLTVMREAIDNYTLDKEAAPQSLDDLVQAGYLREVPTDPMTGQKDWVPQFDNVVMTPDQTTTGMVNVNSNSQRTSPFGGGAYNTW
jgi:general secretion pathway protein G